MKIMIIIRGLPGSGKSTLADHLRYSMGVEGNVETWEADTYFGLGPKYNFVKEDLPKAHSYCYTGVENSLQREVPFVIISNTSLSEGEYKRYIDLARQYDYKIQVIDVHGEFESVHGVPEEHLEKMEARWVPFDRKYLA